MVLGHFYLSSGKGDQAVKKASGRKSKTENLESDANGDRKGNIHTVRKRLRIFYQNENKKSYGNCEMKMKKTFKKIK